METPAFCLPRHGYLRRLDKEGLILPEGKDGAAAQQQVHDQRHATFQLLLQQYLYYQQSTDKGIYSTRTMIFSHPHLGAFKLLTFCILHHCCRRVNRILSKNLRNRIQLDKNPRIQPMLIAYFLQLDCSIHPLLKEVQLLEQELL